LVISEYGQITFFAAFSHFPHLIEIVVSSSLYMATTREESDDDGDGLCGDVSSILPFVLPVSRASMESELVQQSTRDIRIEDGLNSSTNAAALQPALNRLQAFTQQETFSDVKGTYLLSFLDALDSNTTNGDDNNTDADPAAQTKPQAESSTTKQTGQRYVRPFTSVQHIYCDRASVFPTMLAYNGPDVEEGTANYVNLATQGKNTNVRFPDKLHDVLERLEYDGLADVMSWQPHGRCFVIRKPEMLTNLLPRYFPGMTKLTSLQRQLNLYGFRRITYGNDKNGYYHEYFLRHRAQLVCFVRRCSTNGLGVRVRSIPADEPNFYSMPYLLPLTAEELSCDNTVRGSSSLLPSLCIGFARQDTLVSNLLLPQESELFFNHAATSMQQATSQKTALGTQQLRTEAADMKSLSEVQNLYSLLEPRPLPPWPLQIVPSPVFAHDAPTPRAELMDDKPQADGQQESQHECLEKSI
jgi:hypothetical protein